MCSSAHPTHQLSEPAPKTTTVLVEAVVCDSKVHISLVDQTPGRPLYYKSLLIDYTFFFSFLTLKLLMFYLFNPCFVFIRAGVVARDSGLGEVCQFSFYDRYRQSSFFL